MEQRRVDILVGTQMVAKGLDFPGVTLVGVVGADAILNLPDFRSAERAFTLLTQVAGRAGRGERPGKVLIQTYAPAHHALQHASRHDYDGFYREEIEFRRALEYPPFGHLVNLVLSGIEGEKVAEAAGRFCESLQACAGAEVEVLGPAPCPLFRLRGRTRYQILLKSALRTPLHRLLSRLPALRSAVPRTLKLTLDVDPLDML
jgi:primosomal protein N' (replication factor Y)